MNSSQNVQSFNIKRDFLDYILNGLKTINSKPDYSDEEVESYMKAVIRIWEEMVSDRDKFLPIMDFFKPFFKKLYELIAQNSLMTRRYKLMYFAKHLNALLYPEKYKKYEIPEFNSAGYPLSPEQLYFNIIEVMLHDSRFKVADIPRELPKRPNENYLYHGRFISIVKKGKIFSTKEEKRIKEYFISKDNVRSATEFLEFFQYSLPAFADLFKLYIDLFQQRNSLNITLKLQTKDDYTFSQFQIKNKPIKLTQANSEFYQFTNINTIFYFCVVKMVSSYKSGYPFRYTLGELVEDIFKERANVLSISEQDSIGYKENIYKSCCETIRYKYDLEIITKNGSFQRFSDKDNISLSAFFLTHTSTLEYIVNLDIAWAAMEAINHCLDKYFILEPNSLIDACILLNKELIDLKTKIKEQETKKYMAQLPAQAEDKWEEIEKRLFETNPAESVIVPNEFLEMFTNISQIGVTETNSERENSYNSFNISDLLKVNAGSKNNLDMNSTSEKQPEKMVFESQESEMMDLGPFGLFPKMSEQEKLLKKRKENSQSAPPAKQQRIDRIDLTK